VGCQRRWRWVGEIPLRARTRCREWPQAERWAVLSSICQTKMPWLAAYGSATGCKGQRRKKATHPTGRKAETEKGDVATDRRRNTNVRPGAARLCCLMKGNGPPAVIDACRAPGLESRSEKRLREREWWWCVLWLRCEWLEVGFCCPFQNP